MLIIFVKDVHSIQRAMVVFEGVKMCNVHLRLIAQPKLSEDIVA